MQHTYVTVLNVEKLNASTCKGGVLVGLTAIAVGIEDPEWRPLPGHAGYEVSSDGWVRSLDRTVTITCRDGKKVTHFYKGKVLKPDCNKGYRRVRVNGRREHIATFVLETFVGPRPLGQVARHLDDVRTNDQVSNLAWGTQKENRQDAIRNNKRPLKTHCPAGHEYSPENTRIVVHSNGKGRECITCLRERDRIRYAQRPKKPPKQIQHGTRTMYEARKCTCDECRAFNAKRARLRRNKNKK